VDLKLTDCSGWATIGLSGGGAPTALGTPSTEFKSKVAEGPYNNVVFQVLKLSFVVANIR
jgi:hypothetical protein